MKFYVRNKFVQKRVANPTIWLPQTILISPLKDVDDVVGALNKISRCVFGEE